MMNLDERKRKKISLIGSFAFHIFVFLFVALTGLLKFTTLPLHDEIVEITAISGGGGGGSASSAVHETYTPPTETAPVENAPITPDSILEHSDTAKTNVTYEQIQELQEKVEKHEIDVKEAVIEAPNPNPTNNNSVTDTNTTGNGVGTGTNDGDNKGQGEGSGDGEGTGTGEGNGNGNGLGDGSGDDNNIYNSPAVAPRIVKSPSPKYPANERNNKIEGTAVVRFLIGKDGYPESVEIASSSGNAALDQAALNAANKWKFIPAKNGNGQSVRCYATQQFTFQINK